MSTRSLCGTAFAWICFFAGLLRPEHAFAEKTDDPSRESIPAIQFMDDAGRERSLTEFRGRPLLLVPLYTKCQVSCSNLVTAVKKGLFESKMGPNDYSVLLFSFDSSDTSQDLSAFRAKHGVPLSWKIGTANAGRARALMEGIGFRYASASGEFSHANMIAVLTSDLRFAKAVYGSRFPAGQLEAAVAVAQGGYDWRALYRYFFPISLFGFTLSTVYLVHLFARRRAIRETR